MKIKMCEEFYYRAKEKDEDVYNKFNSSKEKVLRNNENIKIYAGEWIKIKQNDFITHFVKPVETIEQIARIYNTSAEQIIKDNNLEVSKLFIGQKLKIKTKKPL